MLRRCVWSRNIKNRGSIYIYIYIYIISSLALIGWLVCNALLRKPCGSEWMRFVSTCRFPSYHDYSNIFRPLKSATFTWPWKHCAMSSVHGAMLPALLACHAISQTRFWRTAVRSRVQPDWRSHHTFSTTQFQPSIFRCYCSNRSFEWLTETRGFALATCFVTVNTPKVLSCTICKDVSCLHRITRACQVSWAKWVGLSPGDKATLHSTELQG